MEYDGGIPENDDIEAPGIIEPEKNYCGGKKDDPAEGGGGNNAPGFGGIMFAN